MNSILGALVGDAAGAVLEGYSGGRIHPSKVAQAMTMPGGGRLRVGPGQVTDDGELTLALYRALQEVPADPTATKEAIAKAYADWYDSEPFDIGFTCATAFDTLSRHYAGQTKTTLNDCIRRIAGDNAGSEANGALMRITGMLPWAFKRFKDPWELIEMAEFDASLSHPNRVCADVNGIYVYALWLITKECLPHSEVLIKLDDFVESKYIAIRKVKNWYFEDARDISDYSCTENIGHVKHAFVLAMYFLRHPEIKYDEAIRITLEKGGDTDTNAAIVGGLVAAYTTGPPARMIRSVLEFDSLNGKGHPRPDKYRPGAYF